VSTNRRPRLRANRHQVYIYEPPNPGRDDNAALNRAGRDEDRPEHQRVSAGEVEGA
jgi:hypothetical protein